MKVYEIAGSVGNGGQTQMHWRFEPTLRAAKAYIKQAKKDWDYAELEIYPTEVKPNRDGLAGALNDFVETACLNEG